MRPIAVVPLILLLLSAPVDIASAQVPARVGTPYTLIDAESRTYIEGGVETPLRGNGPFTGYGYFFWGTQASAFLNAGIAEDTDALSAFRLGGGLRLRAEFPLMLHGYNVEEIFARRFLLLNLAYRFPIWPGQDRVHLQVLADYARVDYIHGHRLARSNLAGVGANLSVALTKRLSLVVGYGYGIDAPRHHGFGGHDVDAQFEFMY